MKGSVVIPTRNRGRAFLSTLESVRNQSYPPDDYEIIIVDSSTDDTPRLVQDYLAQHSDLPKTSILREERVGSHYAKNSGVRASRGEIVAVIEDDAIADKNWLVELFKPFDDPRVAGSGGKVLPRWEAEPPDWMAPYYGFLTVFDLGDEVQELTHAGLVGCNLAVRRDILFQAGGYNPDIMGSVLLGDGEIGLQRKMLRIRLGKLIYAPSAVVWHCIPARRLTLKYMRWRIYNEGTCTAHSVYQDKHPGPGALLWLASKHTAYAVARKGLALLHSYRRVPIYYSHELFFPYHWRQVRYFIQLIHDKSFREFAAREDWISDTAILTEKTV